MISAMLSNYDLGLHNKPSYKDFGLFTSPLGRHEPLLKSACGDSGEFGPGRNKTRGKGIVKAFQRGWGVGRKERINSDYRKKI